MLDQIFNYLNFHFSVEASIVLLILVFLEAVLSADNAIALAAIAQGLEDKKLEGQALNIGLVFAYVLRITLLLTATWVQKFWQFELLGAGYLLWLVFQHFSSQEDEDNHHHGPRFKSLWQAIPVLAFTDLAFSLDSVTTAIAVSQETWLVITGTTIGIITLRFMAGLFIRWLNEYENLEDAGYITVSFVGLRLLLKVINDDLVPPQWLMVAAIGVILAWGFSKRTVVKLVPEEEREKTEVSK
ncbi:TerC family protein [Dolichospermum sp. ST_con]|nr:TerC family protein [Dolichospermum sp. ST_con]MDD1421782.1 TerC family protein [Dolichospermum sp. ST_sed1]MDD1428195.1 TerC family protein [Dolichospermum sp. ST_sed9]MDD1432166.1 TerC family protein [Dolichospermum sp. ST_sed6]MDD1437860.1 TerC family protein [Dolichospermum sp. ST_sed10]MDD1443146.1 TerC family protein [Dolichospermum sp. ST_sed3]MDD1447279.1 TerC family protein [Dolichospermum sp. ST_sed8]MDD1454235.1 TerC family protein [Dolichospermum sp. ST_sed7]MDD1460146.1 TerC